MFTTRRTTTTARPDIIWTLPPRQAEPQLESEPEPADSETVKQAGVNNMDALIIGIVGG